MGNRIAEDGQAARRHPARSEGPCPAGSEARGGLPRRVRKPGAAATVALALALAIQPTTASAQVGHAPGSSPYHDIRKGHSVTALVGHFGGDGGEFGIAPHGGTVYGIHYDLRAGSTIQFGLGLARADLERLIVDPFVELANRVSGPVPQTVTFAEVNLQFNVTGGKSWHGLAPFVGTGVGLTFAGGTPADTSKFKFGRKFYLAPNLGVRFFLTDRLHLRGEARATFWKVKYPTTFQAEPPLEPGDPPDNSNAVITDGPLSEWTTSSWLQVGLGYSFSP